MKNKIMAFKESLQEDVVFNKKEYILTITVCILGAILFGMLITPKKALTIGSFNGNGWSEDLDDEEEDNKKK